MASRLPNSYTLLLPLICLVSVALRLAVCAPPNGGSQSLPYLLARPKSTTQGRFLWDTLGDIITTSDYLPLELNVPDTVSAVASGLNNAWMAVSNHIPRMLWQRLEEMTALFSP